MTYFKSCLDSHLLDLLWNTYWVNTLSSCSLFTVSCLHSIKKNNVKSLSLPPSPPPLSLCQNASYTTQQVTDLSQKLERAEYQHVRNLLFTRHIIQPQFLRNAMKWILLVGCCCCRAKEDQHLGVWVPTREKDWPRHPKIGKSRKIVSFLFGQNGPPFRIECSLILKLLLSCFFLLKK